MVKFLPEIEWFLFLLPLLICFCMMQSRRRPLATATETDVWFTSQGIEEVFEAIKKETDGWRREAESEQMKAPRPIFGTPKRGEIRFEVAESIAPRLHNLMDRREGKFVFELTEVEGGGTSIKASYTTVAKSRMQTFRARLPAKIPYAWEPCSSCSEYVLPEFAICPYCGHKRR